MTGLIGFVQVVHYPLFDGVGKSDFAAYKAQNTRRTGFLRSSCSPPLESAGTTGGKMRDANFPHALCRTYPRLNPVHTLLICFSAVSFLGFGTACFFSQPMKREYVRYGVSHFRSLIGGLQLAGGLGLFAGFAVPLCGQSAAAGLAILMLAGTGLRIHIKDSLMQTLPAAFYLVLNAYLAAAGFR